MVYNQDPDRVARRQVQRAREQSRARGRRAEKFFKFEHEQKTIVWFCGILGTAFAIVAIIPAERPIWPVFAFLAFMFWAFTGVILVMDHLFD